MEDRVKFSTNRLGDIFAFIDRSQLEILVNAMNTVLKRIEKDGFAPVLSDGMVAGNAAAAIETESRGRIVVVSKSGRQFCDELKTDDIAVISEFNEDNWSINYYSHSTNIKPTSDTPLHFSCLMDKNTIGPRFPSVSLHGHALATEKEAIARGIPISKKETKFSTPDDLLALRKLIQDFPYPENKIYIRKGHGFFLLAENFVELNDIYESRVLKGLEN